MADGSGKESDPPVGTGRGLKPRAEKAAKRGRSEYPGGLFLSGGHCRRFFVVIFKPCIFSGTSHLASRRPKGSKTNMLAAANAGLATNQIA
jgi:hypothetical protein